MLNCRLASKGMLQATLQNPYLVVKTFANKKCPIQTWINFGIQQPCWSLTGEHLLNLVLGFILLVKPANGNLVNHCDPLVVLKGVFSELILFMTCSENCMRVFALFFSVTSIIFTFQFCFAITRSLLCFQFFDFCQVNRSNYFFLFLLPLSRPSSFIWNSVLEMRVVFIALYFFKCPIHTMKFKFTVVFSKVFVCWSGGKIFEILT